MNIKDMLNDKWMRGKLLKKDREIEFEGEKYKVLETHRAEYKWKPDTTMNLFKEIGVDE